MRVLIADDDAFVRALLADFLSELGHEVESVENGAKLVKLALSERPDLVITDLYMPEMSGDSVMAMLDMYPDFSGVPVIIVTGASIDEIRSMGIPSEVPIVLKPFNFYQIATEVAKITKKPE